MDNQYLRNLFFTQFPYKLTPLLDDLLDENIESVLSGDTKINNQSPQTDDEYMLALMYGFYFRHQILEELKLSVPEDYSMTLNYRGHQYEFPARL